MPPSTTSRRLVALVAVAALVFASCGSDDDATDEETTTGDDPGTAISIEDAWARSTPAGRGAVYFEITSAADDAIVGASVDPSIAAVVELHETVAADGDVDPTMDSDMDDDVDAMMDGDMNGEPEADDAEGHGGGMMEMREVTSIPLPAGETVVLEPGGLHVMLLDMPEMLEIDSVFDLTLELETGDPITVTVTVRDA